MNSFLFLLVASLILISVTLNKLIKFLKQRMSKKVPITVAATKIPQIKKDAVVITLPIHPKTPQVKFSPSCDLPEFVLYILENISTDNDVVNLWNKFQSINISNNIAAAATTTTTTTTITTTTTTINNKPLTIDEQLKILKDAQGQLALKNNISEAKINNGTTGEWYVCQALGLQWNSNEVHGWDFKDQQGQIGEIKACVYPKAITDQLNINYSTFNLTTEFDNNIQGYYQKIRDHYLQMKGGHYWACYSSDKKYQPHQLVYIERISFKFLAELIVRKVMKNKTSKMNFSGTFCSHCGMIHKFMIMAKLGEIYDKNPNWFTDEIWNELVFLRIPVQCSKNFKKPMSLQSAPFATTATTTTTQHVALIDVPIPPLLTKLCPPPNQPIIKKITNAYGIKTTTITF